MRFDIKSDIAQVMLALDRAKGQELTTALRRGYAAAARLVRDRAKQTSAFTDRTGEARRSWRVSQARKPFNHAKAANTVFYAMFLERAPLNSGYLTDAAEAVAPECVDVVGKALRRHLARLRRSK